MGKRRGTFQDEFDSIVRSRGGDPQQAPGGLAFPLLAGIRHAILTGTFPEAGRAESRAIATREEKRKKRLFGTLLTSPLGEIGSKSVGGNSLLGG
jgi:hypothetical protein